MQVSTTHVDDFDLNWVLMTFDVHGLASDSGAAFHFRIWEEWPRHGYIVDVIGGGLFGGRTDFHEVYSVVGSDVLNYRVEGWVLATSQTPEPGTALLAGAALVIAGCYGRRVRALAARPAARA
ncbi:MAG: hypothetical protein NTV70_14950 [Acidobacteria bacterium]|nr:hypothetical protein [Acidobacteriota bacterium]